MLNQTNSNQIGICIINNLTSQNINDYMYETIYKKNNYVKNKKFIKKYLDKQKTDNVTEINSCLYNGINYKELHKKISEETWKNFKCTNI